MTKPIPKITYISNQLIATFLKEEQTRFLDFVTDHHEQNKDTLIENFTEETLNEIETEFKPFILL
jgi:RAB protein geranylgeranyltransferase component A